MNASGFCDRPTDQATSRALYRTPGESPSWLVRVLRGPQEFMVMSWWVGGGAKKA